MSSLCYISKFVERVVDSQLNDYVSSNRLENCKKLTDKLGHLFITALLSVKNEVHLSLATSVVLLHQSAVFDIVDHGTLLDDLSSCFSVRSVVLDWFKSCL